MSRELLWSQAADDETDEIADYLFDFDPRLALRFYAAAERDAQFLAAMPELGSAWQSNNPALADIHFWPIRKFKNYIIFYRYDDETVEILHVLHAARDLDTLLES